MAQPSRSTPAGSPNLPGYIHRPAEYKQAVEALLRPAEGGVTALTTALRGAGGYGKTTLARAVCEDPAVRAAFPDGIFWVTLGEKVERDALAGRINRVLARMGDPHPDYLTSVDASLALRERMAGKCILLVIDDVWNAAHLAPFLQGGPGCAHLVTTRNSDTLPAGVQKVLVDRVKPKEAAEILSLGLGEISGEDKTVLRSLSDRLRRWPLLLSLANSLIVRMVEDNHASLAEAARDVRQLYDRHGLTAFDPDDPLERNQAAAACLDASLSLLPADETAAFEELAVFAEDEDIPLAAVRLLWNLPGRNLDELEVRRRCQALAAHALAADFNRHTGTLRLHDVIRAYLIKKLGAEQVCGLHRRLVDGYLRAAGGHWSGLPEDGYIHRRLVWHLAESGDLDEQDEFLFDYRWIKCALRAAGVLALLASYTLAAETLHASPDALDIRLMRDWVRLSGHILANDPKQLPSQLLGRLLGFESQNFHNLSEGARQEQDYPWLRPIAPCMTPPGGAEIMTLAGHFGPVLSVVVTPDGRRAVSADHTLKVWDLDSGQEIHSLAGHSDWVSAVSLTPDGQRAISASADRTLKVWDLDSGQEICTLAGHTDRVMAASLTPDGRYALSASYDRTLKIWDLASGQEIHTLSGHSDWIEELAVTPDGRRAVSGSDDHTLKVWDLDSGQEIFTLTGHSNYVTALSLSPDGRRAVSGSDDHTLKVWNLDSGQEIFTLAGHSDRITAICFTPDGRRAISASDDFTLKVWDLDAGQEIQTLRGHSSRVTAVAITPDGQRLISASDDTTLKVWDLNSVQPAQNLAGHTGRVRSVALTRDGQRAVSASSDRTLKVWDAHTGQELHTLAGHSGRVWAVSITPDGRRAVSASNDHTLRIWDLDSGQKICTLAGHSGRVRTLAVTPDGHRAVSASNDRTLRVWDLVSGKKTCTLRGHSGLVTAVALTPDGRRAVSGSSDCKLKVWDLDSGQEIRTLAWHARLVTAVVVTPDGRHAISASTDTTLKVWDLDSGQEIYKLDEHSDQVTAVLLTPDGRRAVSASDDTTLKIWNLDTGQEIHTLTGHSDRVRAVAVTPDGQRVISASWDNTLIVWDLETGKMILVYSADVVIECLRAAADCRQFIAGDRLGRVHFLEMAGD